MPMRLKIYSLFSDTVYENENRKFFVIDYFLFIQT